MAADTTKSIVHVLEQLVLTAGVKSVDVYTAAVDAPSLTAGLVDSVDVTVTGVAFGDIVLGVVSADGTALSADVVVLSAAVSAADTVRVTLFNTTGGTLDAASESCKFIVLNRT